jgi:hypothetical protein
VVKPKVPLKPLWWSKFVFGVQLKKGETIWDKVDDWMDKMDTATLELKFGKSAATVKGKKEKKSDEKEELKLLRIITDPQVVVGKEASLKSCPPAVDCAKALEELDDGAFDIDTLKALRENACPNPQQMKELTDARKANPGVPLALPEQYMWVIGNLPAYQQRLDCWIFVRTYPEKTEEMTRSLLEFEKMIDAFAESTGMASLLAIILAVGNYLNGGTNRGQADGFDVETITKLDSIKDVEGKDIRHYIMELFCKNHADAAEVLWEELAPTLEQINRRLGKDKDGVEQLQKSARVAIEDFDPFVVQLQTEFTDRHDTMQMVLQYFEDPADQFKLRMPQTFSEAKEEIDALVAIRDRAKDKYKNLLNFYKVVGMKSETFFSDLGQFLVSR